MPQIEKERSLAKQNQLPAGPRKKRPLGRLFSSVQYFTSTIPSTRPCVAFIFCSSCVRHCYTHTLCVSRSPVILVVPCPVFAILLLSAAAAAFYPTCHILNPLPSCSAHGDLVLPWTLKLLKADSYRQIILRTLMYTVCDKIFLLVWNKNTNHLQLQSQSK